MSPTPPSARSSGPPARSNTKPSNGLPPHRPQEPLFGSTPALSPYPRTPRSSRPTPPPFPTNSPAPASRASPTRILLQRRRLRRQPRFMSHPHSDRPGSSTQETNGDTTPGRTQPSQQPPPAPAAQQQLRGAENFPEPSPPLT